MLFTDNKDDKFIGLMSDRDIDDGSMVFLLNNIIDSYLKLDNSEQDLLTPILWITDYQIGTGIVYKVKSLNYTHSGHKTFVINALDAIKYYAH